MLGDDIQHDSKKGEYILGWRGKGTSDNKWGETLIEKKDDTAGRGDTQKDELHQGEPSHHLDRG